MAKRRATSAQSKRDVKARRAQDAAQQGEAAAAAARAALPDCCICTTSPGKCYVRFPCGKLLCDCVTTPGGTRYLAEQDRVTAGGWQIACPCGECKLDTNKVLDMAGQPDCEGSVAAIQDMIAARVERDVDARRAALSVQQSAFEDAAEEAVVDSTCDEAEAQVLAAVIRRKIIAKACFQCGQLWVDHSECAAVQCDRCGAHFCGACGHGEARWGAREAHSHAMRCEYGLTTRAARLVTSGFFYQPQQCAVASARYRHDKVWARILEEGGDRHHLLYKLLERDIDQLQGEASGVGIRDVKGNSICRETAEWTSLDDFNYVVAQVDEGNEAEAYYC